MFRMNISAPCVVALTWTLADAQGQTIDELSDPVPFFYGGDDLWPAIEQALEGHEAGEEAFVQLEPEQAFGDYDAKQVCFENRNLFPEHLEPGMLFDGLPAGSKTPNMPTDLIYAVTEIYPTHVVLDGNHPLAGIALRLHLKVHEVREASAEEIEARSLGQPAVSVLQTASAARQVH
jgi:FKBP-type peptidyl-prolyl cis-trans isomerase SlyD